MCSSLIKQQLIKCEAAWKQSEIHVNSIDERKSVKVEHRIAGVWSQLQKLKNISF